jgi:pimeloyl-ACP methyl ester carboxylesterase
MIRAESKTTTINGAELEYCDIGSGLPILFIHGGMGKECSLVLREPVLAGFRLIHFQRRGYGRSSCPEMPVSIEQQSRDCQALLNFLNVPDAHVVGQSYGGAIALQLTVDASAAVRSLTVLEPALPSILFSSADFVTLGERAGELYQGGERRASMEQFGKAVIGERDWDAFASEWLDSWEVDAATIFESDMPALGHWPFGASEAGKISQPVLNLRGANSPEAFRRVWEAVADWIPRAENAVVPDTSHCILQVNPGGAARLIAEHVTRHSKAH